MMTDESSSSYSLAYECEQNQTVISVNKVRQVSEDLKHCLCFSRAYHMLISN